MVSGKEKFNPAVTLRAVNRLITAILDTLYPVGTQALAVKPSETEVEEAQLLLALNYLENQQNPGAIQAQGIFSSPIAREAVLSFVLPQLLKLLQGLVQNKT